MNNNLLKENKVHGDTAFPLGTYSINYSENNIAVDCHWHNEFEFFMVVSGSIDFYIGTSSVTVEAGDVVFINSGELHAGYLNSPEGCNFEAVVFSPELLYNGNPYDPIKEKYIEPLISGKYNIPSIFRANGSDLEKSIINELIQIFDYAKEKQYCHEMLIKGKLYIVFWIILSRLSSYDLQRNTLKHDINSERLKKVMEYIYENYNSKLTIKRLADVLNMSEGHFIRFFKNMVRKTPVEYINYYRVNKAVRLLEENNKKIIEISMDVGFDNVSYFVTIFKHYMKCTPAEYRRTQLK